jgi:hypothetical protein
MPAKATTIRVKPVVTIEKAGPGLRDIRRALGEIRESEVYVGIPADYTMRRDGTMNNATLLYIHTNGSPLHNLPARPVIEPAIADASKLIAPELAAASAALFDRKPNQALVHLKRAGTIGANASKRWFTNPLNGWPPLEPATARAKGSDQPLIDTGALRRAITYVVSMKGAEFKNTEEEEQGESESEPAEAAEQAGESAGETSEVAAEAEGGIAEGAGSLALEAGEAAVLL